jgi:hypothetical protein
MITKELIKDVLISNKGEERRLANALNKALSPFVVIDVDEKVDELYSIINGVEGEGVKEAEQEKKERAKEEYLQFEEGLLEYWNDFTKRYPVLSAVLKVGKDRRKHLKQRFMEAHFKDNYKKAIDGIANSPFLLGENSRKWKINFDFFIHNDRNYVKILEGAYRDSEQVNMSGINAFMKKE